MKKDKPYTARVAIRFTVAHTIEVFNTPTKEI